MPLRKILHSGLRKLEAAFDPNVEVGDELADDYDWGIYSSRYESELAEYEKKYTFRLSEGDCEFSKGALALQKNILPLHPNHRLLYETILQLQPRSAMEIGCGSGDHLSNLAILAPQVELYGCDMSSDQLTLARRRWPNLRADLRKLDITLPHSALLPIVELCYTQCVIMHIQRGNGHLVALANLFKIATPYVVLMENWSSHNFLGDIQELYKRKMIPWSELHCYYRVAPELNRPHLMVASARPLEYESLTDYSTLLDTLPARERRTKVTAPSFRD
jgi:SAM-dependent methyltransferase